MLDITENWDDILSTFPEMKQDIYFTKQYMTLYEKTNSKALCARYSECDKIMLMPYLRGEIRGYYDFETAYGYGGPIANTDDVDWCHNAFDKIYDFLKDKNYICGFIRFHPLMNNEKLVRETSNLECHSSEERHIQVIHDRRTVVVDTSMNIDDIWKTQISSKNRNMIRKAEKNQLVFKAEYDYASYDEFISLYKSTMQRLSADEFYLFDDHYFEALRDNLSNCSFLGTIRKDGKLICAAIFFYSKLFGHYHLEGSDREYHSLGANNYLLWNTICEMHNIGIKEFHLGGGLTPNPEDRLFKFKSVFSDNINNFYIGKEIFNVPVYAALCDEWERRNIDKINIYGKRLLRYRY